MLRELNNNFQIHDPRKINYHNLIEYASQSILIAIGTPTSHHSTAPTPHSPTLHFSISP
jgi:hypothetical protein